MDCSCRGNTLYVAQNVPKSIAVVKLSSDFAHAELERTIYHPTFAFPTSVARYKDRLLVVSSQFDTAGSPAAVSGTQPPVVPFWVTQIRDDSDDDSLGVLRKFSLVSNR